ncbi:hypothetical protein [Paraburkholderia sp. PGU19]|uniref:hypothetical protein n=1 Tax=Paraburkholderia sp. PGU19 TaxID=2735434 RepID=UPI0015DA4CB9|nr:hypothetical protein [Paraburkholderia sp. PGU19]
MKELPETLQRRLMLLVGLSKHVGFRRDRIVWQKSVPTQQAWRVVLAEVNSTNPVFYFGYLPTEPSDEQLAQWVDACLRASRESFWAVTRVPLQRLHRTG